MGQSTPALTAVDERHHPPGEGWWWGESWYFDFAAPDGSLGGYVRIGTYPHQGAVWYWACLVGEGRRLVTVIDHEVPAPRRPSLEIRHDGLWADHVIEVPFDHVTLGCEAFALALDDPAEAYGPMRGERVPFGLDLEWETDGAPYAYPPPATRYEVPCRVHGEVLVGDERLAVDGPGQRDHSWGARDWWALGWTWTAGRLQDGTRFHGTVLRRGAGSGAGSGGEVVPYHPGYVQPPGGTPVGVGHTSATAELGRDGLPVAATVGVGDLVLDVEPVAFAPVLLEDPGGRVSRFPRALCRYVERSTGRAGVGWTEWNQPQRSRVPGPGARR